MDCRECRKVEDGGCIESTQDTLKRKWATERLSIVFYEMNDPPFPFRIQCHSDDSTRPREQRGLSPFFTKWLEAGSGELSEPWCEHRYANCMGWGKPQCIVERAWSPQVKQKKCTQKLPFSLRYYTMWMRTNSWMAMIFSSFCYKLGFTNLS